VKHEECLNVEGKPIATEAIVDVVGCWVVYAEKGCAGQSEELVEVQKTYEVTHISSYKTVECPEK